MNESAGNRSILGEHGDYELVSDSNHKTAMQQILWNTKQNSVVKSREDASSDLNT
jgi:hypothetical protein